MTIFWITLAAVFTLSIAANYTGRVAYAGPSIQVMPNRLLVLMIATILILVSGLRNNIGDTVFYIHSYNTVDFSQNIEFKGDFGFNLYQMILQKISKDPQLLIFMTAFITISLIVYTLAKYSGMFELSIFVFITAGMYTVSMNGIRQFMAAAICFTATKYIQNGNWKKYMAVVLFASTIHQSALILIPIYFIVRSKAWSKLTLILLVSSIFIVLGFNYFTEALFSALGDSHYGQYGNISEGGANVLRLVVVLAPVVLAFVGRRKLQEVLQNSDYIINMSLINALFMLIATQNWIFARFTIYFGLYNLLLISWIIRVFLKRDQRFVYYMILVCYFIYYYYESVISLNLQYGSSYFSI